MENLYQFAGVRSYIIQCNQESDYQPHLQVLPTFNGKGNSECRPGGRTLGVCLRISEPTQKLGWLVRKHLLRFL